MGNYTLTLSKDGKEYDGEVEVDTKKGTEIFHVPKVSSDEEPGDVVYDFKKVSKGISRYSNPLSFLVALLASKKQMPHQNSFFNTTYAQTSFLGVFAPQFN